MLLSFCSGYGLTVDPALQAVAGADIHALEDDFMIYEGSGVAIRRPETVSAAVCCTYAYN